MKNDFDKIERILELQQPIEKVWKAITDPIEIVKWFGSGAHFDLEEGSLGFFEWKGEGQFAIRIECIIDTSYFAWRWMLKQDIAFDLKGSTFVEWSLEKIPEGTRLTMVESGFASAKHHQVNVEGWEQELADLESYLV